MIKSPETIRKVKKHLRKGAAGVALAAAIAPSPASAANSKTQGHPDVPKRDKAAVVQRKLETRLSKPGLPVAWYRGLLEMQVNSRPGGTEFTDDSRIGGVSRTGGSTKTVYIVDPIIAFRGNPKEQAGHNDLTNGDYAFASLNGDSTQPEVKVHTFNRNTMKLISFTDDMGPGSAKVGSVMFMPLKGGGFDFDTPLDPEWNPIQINPDVPEYGLETIGYEVEGQR